MTPDDLRPTEEPGMSHVNTPGGWGILSHPHRVGSGRTAARVGYGSGTNDREESMTTDPGLHHQHEDDLRAVRRYLVDLPDLAAQLHLFRIAGSTPADPDRRSSAGNPSRPPINLAVLDLEDARAKRDADAARTDYDLDRMAGSRRQGILPTLSQWVRLIDGELWEDGVEHAELGMEACTATCTLAPVRARGLETAGPCSDAGREHWTTPTVSGECASILEHLDWCAEQGWFNELRDDVKAIRRDVRQAIGDRDETPLPCLTCGWQMQGMGDFDAARGRYPWYRCTGCRRSITTQSELDRVHRSANDTVTLRYAAEQLERPLSTLKEWRQRGWVQPLGRDTRGHVYSMAALRKVAKSVENGKRFPRGRRDE